MVGRLKQSVEKKIVVDVFIYQHVARADLWECSFCTLLVESRQLQFELAIGAFRLLVSRVPFSRYKFWAMFCAVLMAQSQLVNFNDHGSLGVLVALNERRELSEIAAEAAETQLTPRI